MADFFTFDLGYARQGATAVVKLSVSANVRLMPSDQVSNYRNRRSYRAVTARPLQSPFRMVIPSSGNWTVVVDRQGLTAASVEASAWLEA